MSAAKHTPGPWWPLEDSSGRWRVATYRDEDETVKDKWLGDRYGASICGGVGDHTEARTSGNEEANARLIAAAPDLLHALCELVEAADERGLRTDAAKAVIAKATGGAA